MREKLDENFKKLKGGEIKTLEEMAVITGDAISFTASQKAFEFFEDKKFRELIEFDTLSKLEKDRIFNELVLAALIVIMLTFEAPDLRIEEDFKDQLKLTRDEIAKGYIRQLKDLGIERKFRRDWERLIEMRYKEYQEHQMGIRRASMEMKEKEKGNLSIGDLDDIQALLPIQAAAFGCHGHIRKGKLKGEKDLVNMIILWLGRFYIDIRVITETGKRITPFKRLMVKIKRLLR